MTEQTELVAAFVQLQRTAKRVVDASRECENAIQRFDTLVQCCAAKPNSPETTAQRIEPESGVAHAG